jgi:hypothetical protein
MLEVRETRAFIFRLSFIYCVSQYMTFKVQHGYPITLALIIIFRNVRISKLKKYCASND